ncbi:MAG: hypothetical protein Sw2PiBPW_39880 [Shewanella algae]
MLQQRSKATDRYTLRSSNIQSHDMETLLGYRFSTEEINRLRTWIIDLPWERGERNMALDRLQKLLDKFSQLRDEFEKLAATYPALGRDIQTIVQQLEQKRNSAILSEYMKSAAEEAKEAKEAKYLDKDEENEEDEEKKQIQNYL